MIEKIRVSLWDIFSFLMSGLLAVSLAATLIVAFGATTPRDVFATLKTIPAALLLAIGPLICTLFGMLLEPVANYADRFFLDRLLGWSWKPKQKDVLEERALEQEIRDKYLGGLGSDIRNPYRICKDYIETKALNTPFMVYLSRYGFYRNCTLLATLCGLTCLFLGTGVRALTSFLGCVVIAVITKRRQQDFYSYMAPTVYRAFLIDQYEWKPRLPSSHKDGRGGSVAQ